MQQANPHPHSSGITILRYYFFLLLLLLLLLLKLLVMSPLRNSLFTYVISNWATRSVLAQHSRRYIGIYESRGDAGGQRPGQGEG